MRPAAPIPAVLAKTPLFAGLSFEELSRLAALMHQRSFPARSSVMTSGQPGEAVYVILEGSVKVSTIRPDSTEVIFAVLGVGEVVGEMSLADSLGRSADVVTLEESTFLWMDPGAFRAKVEEFPAIGTNLTQVLSRRLRLANTHSRILSALDVPGRVAAQILALAREYGAPSPGGGTFIPIPLTQSDLAALIGGSRVRVNQALGYFRRHDTISVDPQHRITVLDEEVLSRRAR